MRRDQKGTSYSLLVFFKYKAIVYKPINFIGHVTCLTQLFKSPSPINNKIPRVRLDNEITFLQMDHSAEGDLTQFW